jgi:hypothetical protein
MADDVAADIILDHIGLADAGRPVQIGRIEARKNGKAAFEELAQQSPTQILQAHPAPGTEELEVLIYRQTLFFVSGRFPPPAESLTQIGIGTEPRGVKDH